MEAGAAEVLFNLRGRGTGSLLGSSTENKEAKAQLAAYGSQVVNAAPGLL